MLPSTTGTLLLLLALTNLFVANPLHRRGLAVRYTSSYPNHAPAPQEDTLEENLTPSPSSNNIEDILSTQKLSIFLMNLSKLPWEKGQDEGA